MHIRSWRPSYIIEEETKAHLGETDSLTSGKTIFSFLVVEQFSVLCYFWPILMFIRFYSSLFFPYLNVKVANTIIFAYRHIWGGFYDLQKNYYILWQVKEKPRGFWQTVN